MTGEDFALFTVPSIAVPLPQTAAWPEAGGLGCPWFRRDASGRFADWQRDPQSRIVDSGSPRRTFSVWSRQAGAGPTYGALDVASRAWLFPCTWARYVGATVHLESVAFSPTMPGDGEEASLPLWLQCFRLRNDSGVRTDVSVLFTWEGGWPDGCAGSAYDFQHDNLCLTASLGAGGTDRVGISVPDLHHEGVYLQGMEPWRDTTDFADLVEDWSDDGEVDPRTDVRGMAGMAAWVKFRLRPHEQVEVPFAVVWHMPVYQAGPLAGHERRYVRNLSKRRPDNAVVWLAEQAFRTFGTEMANYEHWLNTLSDWHSSAVGHLPAAERRRAFVRLARIIDADVALGEDGRIAVPRADAECRRAYAAALSGSLSVRSVWPALNWPDP